MAIPPPKKRYTGCLAHAVIGVFYSVVVYRLQPNLYIIYIKYLKGVSLTVSRSTPSHASLLLKVTSSGLHPGSHFWQGSFRRLSVQPMKTRIAHIYTVGVVCDRIPPTNRSKWFNSTGYREAARIREGSRTVDGLRSVFRQHVQLR